MNLNAITNEDILAAADLDDLDAAALKLASLAGITHGDVASICLREDAWPMLTKDQRVAELRYWINIERLYAKFPPEESAA